ncbi:hypothetical protein KCU76_g9642, partial [Aureobasidium melanogenum]
MSTSIHNPSQDSSIGSTRSRHHRSSISLHSKPGLGLIKTISRDFVHGWHTPTTLQKESTNPPPSAPEPKPHKPRYAARDALKGFAPVASRETHDAGTRTNSYSSEHSKDPSRSRQDSLAPISPITSDATKPLAYVEAGLIPDHSFDTWTATWDSAYERRVKSTHHCASLTSPTPTMPEKRKLSSNTRPPLTGRLSVTDVDVKRFVSGDREDRKRGYESPESFLVPRRDTENTESTFWDFIPSNLRNAIEQTVPATILQEKLPKSTEPESLQDQYKQLERLLENLIRQEERTNQRSARQPNQPQPANPRPSSLLFPLAMLQTETDQYNLAEEIYRKILLANPPFGSDIAAGSNLIEVLNLQQKYAEAQRLVRSIWGVRGK